MPRREYRSTFTCAEPGCKDTQFFIHDTRADQNAAHKRQHEHPFKCSRHEHPEQNLRPGNEQATRVLVASRVRNHFRPDEWLDGLYWHEEGQDRPGSGFAFGPGFNAYADEFPEGTRLVITAQIEMPVVAAKPSSDQQGREQR